nr:MAG TPA: hypothetical protein [Caudoviricetes sp.]
MVPWRHWRTSEDFWILFLGVIIKSSNGIAYVSTELLPR